MCGVGGVGVGVQGRIQDLWKGGGAAAVPFEDPIWNFKRARAPPAAPPPESASGVGVGCVCVGMSGV